MMRKVLHAKIHMPTCTGAFPNYTGSITIDEDLLDASNLRASDAVLVGNCRTGVRFETYIFPGKRGSRAIEINGASAHLVEPGDRLIILHFALLTDEEYAAHRPTVLIMNPDNSVKEVMHYEPTGT